MTTVPDTRWLTAEEAGRDAEREACAATVEALRMDEILLACGEMTAKERRLVRAMLPWIALRIRERLNYNR